MRDDRRLTRALVVAAAVEADRIKRYAVARKPLDTPTKLLAFLRDQGGTRWSAWLRASGYGKPLLASRGRLQGKSPSPPVLREIGLAAAAI
jgi:hypothetical protein